MSRYYDKTGKPLTLEEWAGLFDDDEYRRIALTACPGGVSVSTVWLGLDHRWRPGGQPLIFETMAFPGEEQERYSTEEEARAGHAAMVARLSG